LWVISCLDTSLSANAFREYCRSLEREATWHWIAPLSLSLSLEKSFNIHWIREVDGRRKTNVGERVTRRITRSQWRFSYITDSNPLYLGYRDVFLKLLWSNCRFVKLKKKIVTQLYKFNLYNKFFFSMYLIFCFKCCVLIMLIVTFFSLMSRFFIQRLTVLPVSSMYLLRINRYILPLSEGLFKISQDLSYSFLKAWRWFRYCAYSGFYQCSLLYFLHMGKWQKFSHLSRLALYIQLLCFAFMSADYFTYIFCVVSVLL